MNVHIHTVTNGRSSIDGNQCPLIIAVLNHDVTDGSEPELLGNNVILQNNQVIQLGYMLLTHLDTTNINLKVLTGWMRLEGHDNSAESFLMDD
jgi:hypothetical protein